MPELQKYSSAPCVYRINDFSPPLFLHIVVNTRIVENGVLVQKLQDQCVAGVGADTDGRMALDWGVYGVPETFVVETKR